MTPFANRFVSPYDQSLIRVKPATKTIRPTGPTHRKTENWWFRNYSGLQPLGHVDTSLRNRCKTSCYGGYAFLSISSPTRRDLGHRGCIRHERFSYPDPTSLRRLFHPQYEDHLLDDNDCHLLGDNDRWLPNVFQAILPPSICRFSLREHFYLPSSVTSSLEFEVDHRRFYLPRLLIPHHIAQFLT